MRHDATPGRAPISFRLTRLGYLVGLLLAMLVWSCFDLNPERIQARLARAFDLATRRIGFVEGARNIVLFAGWGAVFVLTATRGSVFRSVAFATLTGALISVVVETTQLFLVPRVSSVLEVAAYTVGSLLGAICAATMVGFMMRLHDRQSFIGLAAVVPAAAYGAGVFIEAALTEIPLHHAFLFLPVGMLATAALVEAGRGYNIAFRIVALLSLPLFTATEAIGTVIGYPLSPGAILLYAGVVTIGAWVTSRYLPGLTRRLRGRARPGAFLLAYAAVVLLWSWRPFALVTALAWLADQVTFWQLIPLRPPVAPFDPASAVDMIRHFALMMPIGALLAVWPLRRRGLLAGPLPGIGFAIVLAVGRIPIEARIFDMNDALIGAAAVLLGWMVIRRSGTPRRGEIVASPPAR